MTADHGGPIDLAPFDVRLPYTEPTTPATVGDDPTLLARPRLLDRLPPVPSAHVTVLRAPTGYGKTVLASRWSATRCELPVVWASLRPTDDGQQVATRLVEGVESLGVGTVPAVEAVPPSGAGAIGDRFLSLLREQLATVGDVVVVLDALDAPRRVALVEELERWITTLPPGVRTVVTRRSASGRELTQGGRLHTLGATELAFTPDEVRTVVARMCGVELVDEQLETLVLRTEGWPYAVHVAATGMRGQVGVDAALARLHGGNPHIAAIFSAEVLDGEPVAVQRFLLRTSVLDTLSPGACASIVGEPRAELILRELERAGCFTTAVSDRPAEFRYQALFRDFLRSQLRAAEPDAERRLMTRASEWYAVHSQLAEAARYAIGSGDPDRMIGLVDEFARAQFERGDPEVMLRALDAVATTDRPHVALRRAYLLTMMGETRRAERELRGAGGGPADPGTEAVDQALRASWVFFDAPPDRALAAATRALELLRSTSGSTVPNVLGMTSKDPLEVIALGSRARALWCTGELERAREEMLAILRRPGLYPLWHIHVLSSIAILEAWSGNLHAAIVEGRRATGLADGAGLLAHPATLDADLAIAHVLLERDDLRNCDELLTGVEARVERFRRPATVAMCTAERSSWCLATGQVERGLAAIRRLRVSGEPPPPPIVDDRLRAIEARLLVEQGELVRADAAVESAHESDSAVCAAALRVSVARGDLQQAGERLAMWRNHPTDLQGRIERELWSAIVASERGQWTALVGQLSDRVLADAAAEGHRRAFLDAGPAGERLLRALVRVTPTPFLEGVLRTIDDRHAAARTGVRGATAGAGAAGGDVEGGSTARGTVATGGAAGLSGRELEILRYLPTDLSSAEMADRLFISVNTLKTHLRTIYRKLGVSGRREAIERAEALGIA